MKYFISFRALLGFLVLCVSSSVWAQTAQISGTVKDSSGLAVPGAEIKATQTATSAVRTVSSGADGGYILPDLPVGPYQLQASKEGFATYNQTGIVLQVDANLTNDISLKVGSVTEQVSVQADAALVETRATGISQVIDNTRVVELPLNGRQVSDLIILSGVAVSGGLQASTRNYPTASISIAGGMNTSVVYLLDGAAHFDPFNNLSLPMPFPEALQEFKVETSALQSQNGQHGAGTVSAVMKSGTNEFHGTLFEFLRNGDLNARNTFALTRDSLKRNQFGGVLGGPILRNKLFFFLGEQNTTQASAPTQNVAFVPTAAMLSGDWTVFTSPACNGGRQLVLKAPFINNTISPSLYSVPSVNLVHLSTFPTTTNPCGKVTYGNVQNSTEEIVDSRVDYSLSAKQLLFAHYQYANLFTPTDYNGVNLLSASQPIYTRRSQDAVLGDTYLFSGDMVSSFRATLFRTRATKVNPPLFDFSQIGVQGFYNYPSSPPVALMTITGGFNIYNAMGTTGYTNSTGFQFAEDLSWVKGAHQFGFGANFIHSGMNLLPQTATPGSAGFTATNTGAGLGDFMLGDLSTFSQQGVTPYYFRQNYIGLYAQDTWKVSSHLTMSGGLRWEPWWSPYSKDGHVLHFNMADYIAGVHSVVFPNAPVGALFPGDPGIPDNNSFYESRWGKFAPRLGLAWDPKGDGRMVFRAAYGIFRDSPQLFLYDQIKVSPPWARVVNLTNPVGGFADPWAGVPGGSPFPFTTTSSSFFPPSAQVVGLPENLNQPYVEQWNFAIQRQLGTDWLVSGNYLGNSMTHIISSAEGNPAVYMPGSSCVINGTTYTPCSSTANTIQRRLLTLINPTSGQYFSNIIYADDGGTRHDEGMTLSVQRRQSKGLTIQANYTWSHCIGTATVASFSGAGADILNRRADLYGNCELDRRHNLNASVVYETPQFSSRVVKALASNWQIGGILQMLSGPFLTIGSGVDNALNNVSFSSTSPSDAIVGQRPNQVLPNVYLQKGNQYLNPAAFAQPATGTYGDLGVQNIQGPGLVNLNMSLTRQFRIREKVSLQFRAESFNVANHVNPCAQSTATVVALQCPTLTLNSATFGQILAASDPRINQFALKLVF